MDCFLLLQWHIEKCYCSSSSLMPAKPGRGNGEAYQGEQIPSCNATCKYSLDDEGRLLPRFCRGGGCWLTHAQTSKSMEGVCQSFAREPKPGTHLPGGAVIRNGRCWTAHLFLFPRVTPVFRAAASNPHWASLSVAKVCAATLWP